MTDYPTHADDIAAIIAVHRDAEGPLLPILHAVQAAFGHVSEAAIRQIAAALNLSRAEVHGVVSFYHDFHAAPGQHRALKLCRAEACQARGSEALHAALSPAQQAAVGTVYCLGLCAVGPNAQVGEVLHARLDAGRLVALAEAQIAEMAR